MERNDSNGGVISRLMNWVSPQKAATFYVAMDKHFQTLRNHQNSWKHHIEQGLLRSGVPYAIDAYVDRPDSRVLESRLLLRDEDNEYGPRYHDHVIIATLKNSITPKAHLVLLDYINRVPTPENRAMLTDVKWNTDPAVQKRIVEIKAELDTLKANMPESPYKELFAAVKGDKK
ncbi:hypothetical protein BVX99_01030 [bacterium F16]|nr:hypothetical protein BVX99_01030 [bacterium F16]